MSWFLLTILYVESMEYDDFVYRSRDKEIFKVREEKKQSCNEIINWYDFASSIFIWVSSFVYHAAMQLILCMKWMSSK